MTCRHQMFHRTQGIPQVSKSGIFILFSLLISCIGLACESRSIAVCGTEHIENLPCMKETREYCTYCDCIAFMTNCQKCTLSRDLKIEENVTAAANTRIAIYAGTVEPIMFTAKKNQQSINPDITFLGGYTMIFHYESGEFLGGTLSEDRVIDGIPCEKGKHTVLSTTGSLLYCTLSQDHDFENIGTTIQAHSEIEFNPIMDAGTYTNVRFSREHTIEGEKFPAGSCVIFDSQGNLYDSDNQSCYDINVAL